MNLPEAPQAKTGGRHPIVAAIAWLRSAEAGLLGQGARFAIAGGTVAVVSIAITVTLAEGVGLPFEVAFAIGFGTGIVLHFTLQRLFVWAHDDGFALAIHHQLARYLPIALGNYGLTSASIAILPHVLGVPTVYVYLGTTATFTVISFLLFRTRVFHPDDEAPDR